MDLNPAQRRNTAEEPNRSIVADFLVLAAIIAGIFSMIEMGRQFHHPFQSEVEINLSPWYLPFYTMLSFLRGAVAYILSFTFTLIYARWAAYDRQAEKFLIPLLDILQSMPLSAFLVPIELALVAIFPHSNVGIELSCIIVIFTGQVWNMTFSYYDSLRGTPADFRMLGTLYNFNWWHRFWRIELPFGAQGLLYNSMVSMAGGWFFLNVCETFSSGGKDFRVPGIGSYMQLATEQGNGKAQICGVVAMAVIILITDRLIWTPLIGWSRKFKQDDFGGSRAPQSRVQIWLARSVTWQRIMSGVHVMQRKLLRPVDPPSAATSLLAPGTTPPPPSRRSKVLYGCILVAMVVLLGWGALHLVWLLAQVHFHDWTEIFRDTGITFVRVMAAVIIGTVWTVPFGIWIGLNPKLSGRLQPFIQFVASYPAPMLYPWLLSLIFFLHGTLQTGSVLLILFGTQWYILFNVAGSAAAIPNDMISCADILRLKGWARWSKFLIPAILPGLVTGWLTAAGGAWNATIVAEYVTRGSDVFQATGLGAYITRAGNASDFPRLGAAGLVMAGVVVFINRLVWKRLQTIANDRCRFIT